MSDAVGQSDADRNLAAMIDAARGNPDDSQVTFRINNGDWQATTGSDFLDVWDQPFAGTISIDRVVVP